MTTHERWHPMGCGPLDSMMTGDLDAVTAGRALALLRREYTRDQARLHRDRALSELDAAGTIERGSRERLEEIINSVISA